jgi:hypothetical protein
MDIIKLDVPLFIRLLELAREDIKQDADLHDIAEAVTRLSAHGPATMEDYDKIVQFMQKQGSKSQEVDEAKSSINFGPDDLKSLEKIRDLPTLKAQAFALISKPSAKPMKPEKVEWFKNALERMNSPMAVIKLMYDLMLSGEGNKVVGSRNSMSSNTYRQRFGESDKGEYDREGEMARQDLRTAAEAADELRSILSADDNLPEWVQAKITKALDYLDTSRDYMKSKEPVDELARIKQLGGL